MNKVVIKNLTHKEQVNIFGGWWLCVRIKGYLRYIFY